MRKLLYICEDFVPPAKNGSELVYLKCLVALSRKYEVYAIMFESGKVVQQDTRAALTQLCKAYCIPSGVQRNAALKLVRTLCRGVTGNLIAPRLLEEMGRSDAYKQVREFIRRYKPEVMYIHKYHCVPRVGQAVITEFRGIKLVDLHDDFVEREAAERKALKRLFDEFPWLNQYRPYARINLKHKLSRFSASGSRLQEVAMLSKFDWVLAASESEADRYGRLIPGRVVYCPWPISPWPMHRLKADREYSVGFIASDAVFNLEGLMAFVTRELPVIRQRNPNFSLLVGGGISEVFQTACPAHVELGIRVMGRVKDVSEFYQLVQMIVVPLLNGTGVSLKTLEAASYGIPVLSTPVGVRGLSKHVLPSNIRVIELTEFSKALTQHVTLSDTIVLRGKETSRDPVESYLSIVGPIID
jgi:glycosyltransferase involved in cell wall biosynthesis